MQNRIFIDTGAFVAKYLANDSLHARATKVWASLSGKKCMTSNHVLDETLTLLGRRAGYMFASDRAEAIMNSDLLSVYYSSREDEIEALEYFKKFSDQGISFTDATSFAIMKRFNIKTVFSFDVHFDRIKTKRLS